MSVVPTRRVLLRHCSKHPLVAVLVLLVLLSGPLVACSDESASDDRAPTVRMPVLEIGKRPILQTQRYDPMFSQVSLRGHTYTLPCLLREFVDRGWRITRKEKTLETGDGGVVSLEEFDAIEPDNGAVVMLDDDEGNWMRVGIYNGGTDQVAVEEAQVWGMTIFAETVEPYPGIQRGVSREDVERILGKADDFADGRLVYLRNPLTLEQAVDLSGEYDRGCAVSPQSCHTRAMSASRLELSVVSDGTLYGTYDISLASSLSPGRKKKRLTVPGPYHCDPAAPSVAVDRERSFDYSYVVPAELRGSPFAAEYMIDGQRFAVWSNEVPACDVMSYETMSEQVAYLKFPNQDSGDGWGHQLLWNGKESSAAVTTFKGQGTLTGDEVMRVALNYCDWERRERVSLRFSIIGLDPGTKISEEASTYLLGVVSDVAASIERT